MKLMTAVFKVPLYTVDGMGFKIVECLNTANTAWKARFHRQTQCRTTVLRFIGFRKALLIKEDDLEALQIVRLPILDI